MRVAVAVALVVAVALALTLYQVHLWLCLPTPLIVPRPPPSTPREFAVATYNACLLPLPVAHDGNRRVQHMATAVPAALAAADVLVLCELISPFRTARLLHALSGTWPHQSDTPRALGRRVVCGGVRVVSRWPIIAQATHVYAATDLATADGLAAKGVVYCAFRPPRCTHDVHVFATHMHAAATAQGDSIRTQQVHELRAFIDAQRIPARDVVLIAGDLNMDLDVAPCPPLLEDVVCGGAAARGPLHGWVGPLRHTSDERTNTLVGVDGNCTRGACRPRLLDGVFVADTHRQPAVCTWEVVPVRAGAEDLSDHHALLARVTTHA